MKKLLIVDDDPHLRALVRTYAEIDGFCCTEAGSGEQALAAMQQGPYDMLVLDVMMPGKDGFETLGEIRKESEVPVIMLTARKEEYDKLLGFNLGADDYLSKPFSPKELMARIRAVLRRDKTPEDGILRFGRLTIQENARTVLIDDSPVTLTPLEFKLLTFLAHHNNIVLDRDTILKNVWGYDYFGDTRTVDTHVKSLRERMGSLRGMITTIWGTGYKFAYDENCETASSVR